MIAAPRVFLSYSHDSEEHRRRVLVLSERLRADGIDATVDQYIETTGPSEGWPRWMESELRTADFVLLVCSPLYHKRVEGREEPGHGRGTMWEASLIYQYIYNAAMRNEKFVPVLLGGATSDDIPLPLQGVPNYSPETETGYEALYRKLTGQPRVQKGKLGALRPLPPGAVTLPKLDPSEQAIVLPRRPIRTFAIAAVAVAAAGAGLWLQNRLPADYTVHVSVLDQNGNPTDQARVSSSIGGEIVRSDSEWQLKIQASSRPTDGKFEIRATAPAMFSSGRQEVQLGNRANLAATIRLSLETNALVHGIVVDRHQRAVSGARVSVVGQTESVVTGADGSFQLPAHAADGQQVEIRIEKDGYPPVVQGHPAGSAPATVVIDRS